jgi:hypothetical protein
MVYSDMALLFYILHKGNDLIFFNKYQIAIKLLGDYVLLHSEARSEVIIMGLRIIFVPKIGIFWFTLKKMISKVG